MCTWPNLAFNLSTGYLNSGPHASAANGFTADKVNFTVEEKQSLFSDVKLWFSSFVTGKIALLSSVRIPVHISFSALREWTHTL